MRVRVPPSAPYLSLNITPVSPYKEHEIVSYHIDPQPSKIDTTISKIEQGIDLLLEYRTALISDVVTGKIKVS